MKFCFLFSFGKVFIPVFCILVPKFFFLSFHAAKILKMFLRYFVSINFFISEVLKSDRKCYPKIRQSKTRNYLKAKVSQYLVHSSTNIIILKPSLCEIYNSSSNSSAWIFFSPIYLCFPTDWLCKNKQVPPYTSWEDCKHFSFTLVLQSKR